MFTAVNDEIHHVRNQVLSICDLKQTGEVPSGKACAAV
jgi:hypothetical protein